MMSEKEAFLKLVETIEKFLQLSRVTGAEKKQEITMDTDIYEDLGIDSLEAMDIVGEIENVFGITVEAQEMLTKKKISDIVTYIMQSNSSN
ncbi:MAG: acyl carrier protein [Candidatus Omnitrophica bacterium]|nr:acyl carrier protein [Candidatus Omnitrophota bacterium]